LVFFGNVGVGFGAFSLGCQAFLFILGGMGAASNFFGAAFCFCSGFFFDLVSSAFLGVAFFFCSGFFLLVLSFFYQVAHKVRFDMHLL